MGSEEKDNETKSFETDMGINAKVDRHEMRNELGDRANRMLCEAGQLLNPVPKSLKYLGSFAVHTYQSPQLEQLFFAKQTRLDGMPEPIASKAFEDLRGDVMGAYERKRKKKRSGF